MIPEPWARMIAEALAEDEFDDNPYRVPPALRVDDDALDPLSVANPDGEDLDWVDPDDGDVVNLLALEQQ